jgi:hypothetical protein
MNEQDIKDAVTAFVHKYLDVHPEAEKVVVDYAFQTWQALPYGIKYLRFMGSHASGKTRAGEVMAAICKNAVRVAGYSPAALIFEIGVKGILPIFDDINLRDDEIKQVLTVGGTKGTRIVRMMEHEGQYVPVHFDVFGYKIILSCLPFRECAIESRCITVNMRTTDRMDIPRVLDGEFEQDKENIQSALRLFYAEGEI